MLQLDLGQIEKIKVRYLRVVMDGLSKRDTSECVSRFRLYLEGYADCLSVDIETLENQLDRIYLGTHDMTNELYAYTDDQKGLFKRVNMDLKYHQ